jgi:hypothetical protein
VDCLLQEALAKEMEAVRAAFDMLDQGDQTLVPYGADVYYSRLCGAMLDLLTNLI